MAVGHSILVVAYHLFRDGNTYDDLGWCYFDHTPARRSNGNWSTASGVSTTPSCSTLRPPDSTPDCIFK